MASGLSMPIGFKNGTNGSLDVAINALQSAASSHRFMGINPQGQVSLIKTSGNPDGHVILRGGKQPNYDSVNISECEAILAKHGLKSGIVVDCSHGNSNKDYRRQPLVATNVFNQIVEGNKSIIGIMLESNIKAGNQSSDLAIADMEYGVSVTDACIDLESTKALLKEAESLLSKPLKQRI
jgi:3-deoxy-7-phosphoheptulonate synthase